MCHTSPSQFTLGNPEKLNFMMPLPNTPCSCHLIHSTQLGYHVQGYCSGSSYRHPINIELNFSDRSNLRNLVHNILNAHPTLPISSPNSLWVLTVFNTLFWQLFNTWNKNYILKHNMHLWPQKCLIWWSSAIYEDHPLH